MLCLLIYFFDLLILLVFKQMCLLFTFNAFSLLWGKVVCQNKFLRILQVWIPWCAQGTNLELLAMLINQLHRILRLPKTKKAALAE